jgi:transposase
LRRALRRAVCPLAALGGLAADTESRAARPTETTGVDKPRRSRLPGETARSKGRKCTLNTRRIAALPILEHFLCRLRLREFLCDHLPHEDGRTRVPTATALLVLLRNLLISREPLYGVGEWAARHEPKLFGLPDVQVAAMNDDRVGRALDRLFDANLSGLALKVAAHAVREFDVSLDQLHNDSTTITFHGDYESAEGERTLRGQLRLAVTWGHNKDHRPDLKQLLYILTVTGDGAVPVQFRVESGNATDDRSHQETWELLCQLTGRRDFLYIADCKLATTENMAYLHQRGGRFLSVLPRTRSEDAAFRTAVLRGEIQWRWTHDKYDDKGQLTDRFSICKPASQTTEGYRLIWYHSTRKAELDAEVRLTRLEKALKRLDELRAKLASSRTRYRSRAKVAEAVEALLRDCEVTEWISVEIEEQVTEKFRQERRGRPGQDTRYVREEKLRYSLKHRIELERLDEEARCDGIFPLVSNESKMTEQDLLLAYKQQPAIERRFEHLKTDFVVAPMYLKEVSRIQALLCVYFFVLLVEALLERELRRAMEREGIESLPLYSE